MNVLDKNIKITFQTKLEEDVITWENHVDEIMNGIVSRKKAVFKVFMNNLMPIKEIDNTVRELCNKIKSHFHTTSKYYRSNECIAADYTEMLSSVTFYIEIRINEIRI